MISTKLCRYFIVKIYQFPCGNMAAAINELLYLSKQENLSSQKVQFYKQAEKTHRPPPPQKPWKAEYFLSKKNSESSEPFRFKEQKSRRFLIFANGFSVCVKTHMFQNASEEKNKNKFTEKTMIARRHICAAAQKRFIRTWFVLLNSVYRVSQSYRWSFLWRMLRIYPHPPHFSGRG